MIGRAAYHTPYLLADIERDIFKNKNVPSQTGCNRTITTVCQGRN